LPIPTTGPEETRRIREREGRAAAAILGAEFHESLASDLCIFYEERLLRRLAAVVRRVRPRIVLTHSPDDYMEDRARRRARALPAQATVIEPAESKRRPYGSKGRDRCRSLIGE
jgi:LmbE family N-acetylglucosaminyl deacetylase